MKKVELGSIEQIDVREIWEKEDADFTPWLAQEENIRRSRKNARQRNND